MKAGPGQLPGPVSMKSSRSAQHSTSLQQSILQTQRNSKSSRVQSPALLPFGRKCASGVGHLPDSVLHFRLTGDSNPTERTAFAFALTNSKELNGTLSYRVQSPVLPRVPSGVLLIYEF